MGCLHKMLELDVSIGRRVHIVNMFSPAEPLNEFRLKLAI